MVPRFFGMALLLPLAGCTTVEPGQDFNIADVVYDENFYYCRIEPMLFQQKCGPGDPALGDGTGSCHFNVTSYRLTSYTPLLGDPDGCGGTLVPPTAPTPEAKTNYSASQAKMQLDPKLAPLLNRPIAMASTWRTSTPSPYAPTTFCRHSPPRVPPPFPNHRAMHWPPLA